MSEETSAMRARIEALEVRIEVHAIITTALLALAPHEKIVAAIEVAADVHDANLLYGTSLSEQQRLQILEHLKGFADSLRPGQQ